MIEGRGDRQKGVNCTTHCFATDMVAFGLFCHKCAKGGEGGGGGDGVSLHTFLMFNEKTWHRTYVCVTGSSFPKILLYHTCNILTRPLLNLF